LKINYSKYLLSATINKLDKTKKNKEKSEGKKGKLIINIPEF
jgi:hypothetical protein